MAVMGLMIVVLLAAAGVAAFAVAERRRAERLESGLTAGIAAQSEELRRQADAEREAFLREVLTANREVLAGERARGTAELDGKKAVIDERLASMDQTLGKVVSSFQQLEAERSRQYGELSAQLTDQRDGLASLLTTTQGLREALSSSKARGQWGERMAEDVLRLAGFLENVNYRKQRAVEGGRGIPDFTFFLPNELVLHMDVKFPLDNYIRSLEATSELDEKRYREAYLPRRTGAGEGAPEPRLRRPRRGDGRLRAALHPQRGCVRVHPRARRRHCRGRGPQRRRLLLAVDAVLGARADPPDVRQLPARAHVRPDPRAARRVRRPVGPVHRPDGQGRPAHRERAQGVRDADRRRAAGCSSVRSTASTRSAKSSCRGSPRAPTTTPPTRMGFNPGCGPWKPDGDSVRDGLGTLESWSCCSSFCSSWCRWPSWP